MSIEFDNEKFNGKRCNMNYLVSISVFFKDGFAIEDIDDDWYDADKFDDAADAMAALEEQHGEVTETQLDGYDLPGWLYDKVGIHGLYELEDYVQRNQIADLPALFAFMEDQRYSEPYPWVHFDERYIGRFGSVEEFAVYIHKCYGQWEDIPDRFEPYVKWEKLAMDASVEWVELGGGYYFWR